MILFYIWPKHGTVSYRKTICHSLHKLKYWKVSVTSLLCMFTMKVKGISHSLKILSGRVCCKSMWFDQYKLQRFNWNNFSTNKVLEHSKDINTKRFLPELPFVTTWLSRITLQINSAMPCCNDVRGQGGTVSYNLHYRERSGQITAPRIGGKCPLNAVVKRGMCLAKITPQFCSPLLSHYNDTHTTGVQLSLHTLNSTSLCFLSFWPQ